MRSYPDTHAFIAGPGRTSRMGVPGDVGGWDVADGFRLAKTDMAGTPDSEWRISVLDRMVYAVLRRFPARSLHTFDGPVWIIADVPEGITKQPDSLLVATNWIRTCFAALDQAQLELRRRS